MTSRLLGAIEQKKPIKKRGAKRPPQHRQSCYSQFGNIWHLLGQNSFLEYSVPGAFNRR
jgi:hypothetical protein